MIKVRRGEDRGRTALDWLDSRHSFSFGDYRDRQHMGFRSLRVINEDRIDPGGGFATHGHRDMEIVTYVLAGALEHKDSLGSGSVIRPGEVQRMTAGTGIRHSERNQSDALPVHLLQIWILPERDGLDPGYEQRSVAGAGADGALRLIGSRDGCQGAVTIHQDVELYAGRIQAGRAVSHPIRTDRHAWVQAVDGCARVNGEEVHGGDGVALSQVDMVAIEAESNARLLLFDLA